MIKETSDNREVIVNRIVPDAVWVGHAGDGRAVREMFDLGIRAVVQLAAEELPAQLPRDFVFLRFPLLDGPGNDPDLVGLAVRTVAALLRGRVPTLVCCGAGVSRAPAVVAAALAAVRQSGPEECLRAVAACHPLDVSPGLWADVIRMTGTTGADPS